MLRGRKLGRPRHNEGRSLPSLEDQDEGAIVWGPEDNEADSQREQAVLTMTEHNRPENTKRAYNSKIEEYYEYCRLLYPHDRNKYILKPSYVYRFIFYQAMRPKKKRGGKPSQRSGEKFDLDLFNQTMAKYSSWLHTQSAFPEEPDDPVGESTIALYKTVIRTIYMEQVAQRVQAQTWDQIWTLGLRNIHNLVKIRRPAADKRNFKEKFDSEFAPYEIAEEFPTIESMIWSKCKCNRSAAAWMRHRFCLLFSTNGILRCESLFRADLSDFVGLWWKSYTDVHPIYILILQIAQGTLSKIYCTRNPYKHSACSLTKCFCFACFACCLHQKARQTRRDRSCMDVPFDTRT